MVRWVWSSPGAVWRQRRAEVVPGRVEADLEFSGRRDQTWEGFGGCFNELGWDALQGLARARREQVLRDLFDPRAGRRLRPRSVNTIILEGVPA
jgi:glucosylceramidase